MAFTYLDFWAQVSEMWKANMRHPQASEVVNKDIISHFVLRLVYCRTWAYCTSLTGFLWILVMLVSLLTFFLMFMLSEELRRWFLTMETALFRYRFRLENLEAQVLTCFSLAWKFMWQILISIDAVASEFTEGIIGWV